MITKRPETPGHCLRCGKEIPAEETYCASCVVSIADENIEDKSGAADKPATGRHRGRRRWLWRGLIVAVSLAVMLIQAPRVARSLRPVPPIRVGIQDTDAVTDQCIRNLWKISRILQEGGNIPPELECPACHRPYDIVEVAGKTLARCPDPSVHGLRELRVSSESPCPEVH